MPGVRSAHFVGAHRPRIPATYDGFASFENLTYPVRSVTLHTVGSEGPSDYIMAGYGDYVELPLAMVREATLFATDDPAAGAFTIGYLFTSQRVRYGVGPADKAGWVGAMIAAAGAVPASSQFHYFDDFNRPDTTYDNISPVPGGWPWAVNGDIDSARLSLYLYSDNFSADGTLLVPLQPPIIASVDILQAQAWAIELNRPSPDGVPIGSWYGGLQFWGDLTLTLNYSLDGGMTWLTTATDIGAIAAPPTFGASIEATPAALVGRAGGAVISIPFPAGLAVTPVEVNLRAITDGGENGLFDNLDVYGII
jgi:hypothetical protein